MSGSRAPRAPRGARRRARVAAALLASAACAIAAPPARAERMNATAHTNAPRPAEVRFYVVTGAESAARAVARLYEQRHAGTRVVVRAESASRLERDILIGGAETDAVLLDAAGPFASLASRGMLADATRTCLFTDDVVLAGRASGPRLIGSLREILAADSAGIAPLALCDSLDPVGAAARELLARAELGPSLAARALHVTDARAAAAAVETGAAAFAFVTRASVRNSARARVVWTPEPSAATRLDYSFALLRRSARRREAIDFHRFLISSPAMRLFAAHGFAPPAPAVAPR